MYELNFLLVNYWKFEFYICLCDVFLILSSLLRKGNILKRFLLIIFKLFIVSVLVELFLVRINVYCIEFLLLVLLVLFNLGILRILLCLFF